MELDIIIGLVISICIYVIGVFLHVKIIQISRKDKEMTWRLDLAYSCLVIAHHGHCVVMEGITYIVDDLHTYTGEWFCYCSKVATYYGNLFTTSHSLVISILKYVIIVHWMKSRNWGHEKIKRAFFWIHLVYPLVMILINLILKPDYFQIYDAYARIDRCLGDPKNNWGTNSNRTQIKAHSICQTFATPLHEDYLAYTVYITKTSICWGQIITVYLIGLNVFEIIMYCKIFSFMQR